MARARKHYEGELGLKATLVFGEPDGNTIPHDNERLEGN
jgi:hypothetical protein